MSNEANAPETSPSTEAKPKPAPTKPLLDWARERKTKRDLLSLLVLARGWSPLQPANTSDETVLSEDEYVAGIAEAEKIVSDARKTAKRASGVVVLTHPKFLIAMIVRRPTPMEADRLVTWMKDDKLSEEETAAKMRDDLAQRTLWPKEGSEPFGALVEDYPLAFGNVFPMMVLSLVGQDTNAAKKVE